MSIDKPIPCEWPHYQYIWKTLSEFILINIKKWTKCWEKERLLSPMGNWKWVAVDSNEKYFIQMWPFKRKNKNSIFKKGTGLIFPKAFTRCLSESSMNECIVSSFIYIFTKLRLIETLWWVDIKCINVQSINIGELWSRQKSKERKAKLQELWHETYSFSFQHIPYCEVTSCPEIVPTK